MRKKLRIPRPFLVAPVALAVLTTPIAAQVDLHVSPGATAGEVELEWTGGQSPFRVFRGLDPAAVNSPASEIARTNQSSYTDSAPAWELVFYRVTDEVTVDVTTLSYGGASAQSLDLYTPQTLPSFALPVAVLAHGGLWQSGDKSALATLCRNIVEESGGALACASINYRLSDDLGGVCTAPGVDTYREQLIDMAAAYALLQERSDLYGLDPTRFYVGGHSAGGHLAQELNLLWPDFAQPCSLPGGCPAAAGAIGFEGIYDIAAWDAYDDDVWNGQFFCATRKAFGYPGASGCVDEASSLPCWDVGSPIYLARNAEELGIAPAGDALIIHSPGDTWVDINEAIQFGAALAAAFPATGSIVSTDGSCATGQHNDPLGQLRLATCIANFIASGGAGI